MTKRSNLERGFTLIEMIIAVTLVSLLAVGLLMAMHVGLSALGKSKDRLMSNRRVMGVQRILEQQLEGMMPVTANCLAGGGPPARVVFFEGQAESMRFASTYSLSEAGRGDPKILEFQVIPGADAEGVRLIVNERLYAGPMSAGVFCSGIAPDPLTGQPNTIFVPIETGPLSFVLADKLLGCRFEYREPIAPGTPEPRWVAHLVKPYLPDAVRISLAPL
ncbi:MAG: PulJ/GspJ family protein, partial [Bryobacteraceae bacterium]